ncbi:hypothetical protein F5Y05DRAFT_378807 [Hypoxylon sp. FL0543]|nr:hypothetical protein F5Y05DRAFT_378807 [Hypoxylon sp. FL0543]
MSNTLYSEATSKSEPRTNMSYLLELPVEVCLNISDHLLQVDAVCLALTCKALLCLLGGRDRMRLEPPDKETLLCRLEADVTGVVYCHTCHKLMPFDDAPPIFGFRLNRLPDSQFPKCVCSSMVWCSGANFRLPYYLARLATNYQLLGPKHGIPLSYLSYEYRRPYLDCVSSTLAPLRSRLKMCQKEAAIAKLIGNELFIRLTHTIFHEEADTEMLQKYIAATPFYICKHTTFGAYSWNQDDDVNLPALDATRARGSDYHNTGSCRRCMTDWDTSIEWTDGECGWVVRVKAYYGLGRCRSPSDPKWRALSTMSMKCAYRDVPMGAIKQRWLAE